MNFAPRELSQKLQEMGCSTFSEFFYREDGHADHSNLHKSEMADFQQAYILEDFLSNTGVALKNCEIVWGITKKIPFLFNSCPTCGLKVGEVGLYANEIKGLPIPRWYRHAYLDSGKDFWQFLQETCPALGGMG